MTMAPCLHQRPTLTTLPQVRAWLASRQAQLDAGEASYIIHRCEIGRPRWFLNQVRLALPQARAFYVISPWPWTAPSNVLVVRPREQTSPEFSLRIWLGKPILGYTH